MLWNSFWIDPGWLTIMGVYCHKELQRGHQSCCPLAEPLWMLGITWQCLSSRFLPVFIGLFLWSAIKMKCGGQLFSTTVVPPPLLRHQPMMDNKGVCWFFFSCLRRWGWGTLRSASLPYPPVVWPQPPSRRTATGPGVVYAPVLLCFCSTFSVSPRYLALLCNLSQKRRKNQLQMTGEKRWADQVC